MSRNVRNAILTVIVDIVLIAAYVLITLLLESDRETAFWVVFGASIAVIASQILFYPLVVSRKDGLIFSIPALRIGYSFTVLQILYTAFYISKGQDIDGKFIIAGQIAILAIYIVLLIFGVAGMSFAKEVEDNAVKNNNISTRWAIDAKMICEELAGTAYEKKAKMLLEELQYANPKSFDSLKDKEDAISAVVASIRENVEKNSIADVDNMIDDCIKKIKERNELCKISK